MSEERCETCRFYQKYSEVSVCRRNPPQLCGWFLQGGEFPELARIWQARFPEVGYDDWCGEYQPANDNCGNLVDKQL